MEVNQNCSCRLKLKNESKYVCTTCDVNYLCGTCGECLERTEYRKNGWNQIYNDTQVRVMERCESEGRLNPYQLDKEHPEQEMRNLRSIDEVNLDDTWCFKKKCPLWLL